MHDAMHTSHTSTAHLHHLALQRLIVLADMRCLSHSMVSM